MTIRKGETAILQTSLDDEFVQAIRAPDTVVTIRYEIHENIAKRFGLWSGALELRETSGSLRKKLGSKQGAFRLTALRWRFSRQLMPVVRWEKMI